MQENFNRNSCVFLLPVLTVLLLFSSINLDVEVKKLAAFLFSSRSFYHKFQAGGQLAGDSAVETDIFHNRHFRNERETGSNELSQRLLGLLLETGGKIDQSLPAPSVY